MKRVVLIILIIILLPIILFLIIKNNTFKMYYKSNHNYKITNETLEIKHTKSKNYLTYDDIKLDNIFKKYINEDDTFVLFDADEDIRQMVYIDSFDTYIDIFINGIKKYDDNKEDYITKEQREKIIQDNNIKDDIELIKYMINYMNKEFNMFSSTLELKTYAYINEYLSNVIPLLDDYREIVGDYKGIIINEMNMEFENSILVNLYFNDKRYIFSFIGDVLSEEDIIKLIGTVVVDEK